MAALASGGLEAATVNDFIRCTLLQEDPQKLLNRYHIRFTLLASDSPLNNVLPYLPGWHKAYADSLATVFVRD